MNRKHIYLWSITDPASVPIEAYAELCRLLNFNFIAEMPPSEFASLREQASELGFEFTSIERIPCETEPVR